MTIDAKVLTAALREVIDPEVGLNIVDLGLVYRLDADEKGVVMEMTMTTPACPMGEQIATEAEAALLACVPAGTPVNLSVVWEPPWSPERMSRSARAALGWF